MVSFSKFTYIIRMTFMSKLAYTKAVWFNIAGTVVSIVVYYYLWQFVFMGRNELVSFTMSEMTTYVILSRILSSQFSDGINMEFSEWVYEGNIGIEMLRPVSIMFTLFSKRAGEFCFFVLFRGIPILIVSFLILHGAKPAGGFEVVLFITSVLLSIGIMFFFEFLVGLCSFYTLNNYGLKFMKSSILSILSGGIVPLFLFPDFLAKLLNYLPFAGMVSIPANIFLGKYGIQDALFFILIQCFWIAAMAYFTNCAFRHIIKKVIVQGG